MKENVQIDQMIVLLGGILIMLLLLAMGIAYFEGMTHIKTFIYAMCFWTVDIYWGFVEIICIRKRIADMLRGEVNHG